MKVDNLLLFGTERQSIQLKRTYLKNNKKWVISKLSTLPAYLKSLSDYIELVGKVDLKQCIWTFPALWDPSADPIIVRQNWANREQPQVSPQSVCGLGEAVLQEHDPHRCSSATLREEQNKKGLLEAADTSRTQSWTSLWLEQRDTARVISFITKSTLCRSCFVQEGIIKMSHRHLAWRDVTPPGTKWGPLLLVLSSSKVFFSVVAQ